MATTRYTLRLVTLQMTPMSWAVLTLCLAWMVTRVVTTRFEARRRSQREARMSTLLEEQAAIYERIGASEIARCGACGRAVVSTAERCPTCGESLS